MTIGFLAGPPRHVILASATQTLTVADQQATDFGHALSTGLEACVVLALAGTLGWTFADQYGKLHHAMNGLEIVVGAVAILAAAAPATRRSRHRSAAP